MLSYVSSAAASNYGSGSGLHRRSHPQSGGGEKAANELFGGFESGKSRLDWFFGRGRGLRPGFSLALKVKEVFSCKPLLLGTTRLALFTKGFICFFFKNFFVLREKRRGGIDIALLLSTTDSKQRTHKKADISILVFIFFSKDEKLNGSLSTSPVLISHLSKTTTTTNTATRVRNKTRTFRSSFASGKVRVASLWDLPN